MNKQCYDIGGALMMTGNPLYKARPCIISFELLLEGRALRNVVHGGEEEEVLNKYVSER